MFIQVSIVQFPPQTLAYVVVVCHNISGTCISFQDGETEIGFALLLGTTKTKAK